MKPKRRDKRWFPERASHVAPPRPMACDDAGVPSGSVAPAKVDAARRPQGPARAAEKVLG